MRKYLIILGVVLFTVQLSFAEDKSAKQIGLENRIENISAKIGEYPPNIQSDKERKKVEVEYLSVKRELDQFLEKNPKDLSFLYLRGSLQAMGHNFDYPKSWEGASNDLKEILRITPNNEQALLALARLWVNSNPELAKNAENLFRAAQCYHGKEPLEPAQSGLFFALYYQGKIEAAFLQVAFLKKTWPDNDKYFSLYETTKSVLDKSSGIKPVPPPDPSLLKLATCETKN